MIDYANGVNVTESDLWNLCGIVGLINWAEDARRRNDPEMASMAMDRLNAAAGHYSSSGVAVTAPPPALLLPNNSAFPGLVPRVCDSHVAPQ